MRAVLQRLQREGKLTEHAPAQEDPWTSRAHGKKPISQSFNTISGEAQVDHGTSAKRRRTLRRMEAARDIIASVDVASTSTALTPAHIASSTVTFNPLEGRQHSLKHSDALVMRIVINEDVEVNKVFVDSGSSVNIMFDASSR